MKSFRTWMTRRRTRMKIWACDMSDLRFLLDTNIVSAVIKQPAGMVARKFAQVGSDALGISIIVACEMRYGAHKKGSARLSGKVDALLEQLPILPLDTAAVWYYAQLRCELERRGKTIGANDQLIAAHALALDVTLVTTNVGEFSRVPGLRLENWLADE